jgi:alpha-glucosidase
MTAPGAGGDATRISETPRLERLPVFVRAGTILPRQPLVQSTSQRPVGPLYLDVFPGGDCSGTLYLDDGHSMGFERGDFLRQVVRCTVDDRGNVAITFDPRQGSYRPWWKQIEVIVHGRSGRDRVSSSTVSIRDAHPSSAGSMHFYLSDIPNGGTIKVDRAYD